MCIGHIEDRSTSAPREKPAGEGLDRRCGVWGVCVGLDRVCVCVCVGFEVGETGPFPHLTMIMNQIRMEGFLVGRWEHKNKESLRRLLVWKQEASRRSNTQTHSTQR